MATGLYILLVEDSLIAQVVIKKQLATYGCEVDIASDGIIALDKASKTLYQVILMDIGLGDGPDGFEVTKSIKDQKGINSDTPIMAITAHNEPEFNEKAVSVGMVGYFNKPFTSEDAEKIINFIIDEAEPKGGGG